MGASTSFELDPTWLDKRLESTPFLLSSLRAQLALAVDLGAEESSLPSWSEVRWMLNRLGEEGELAFEVVTTSRGYDLRVLRPSAGQSASSLAEVLGNRRLWFEEDEAQQARAERAALQALGF